MSKTASFIDLGFLRLKRKTSVPLAQQLYEQLRTAIFTGQLSKGHRLPSSRSLASELGVSRTTVMSAFDQLTAEGYLRGNIGSGTFVSKQLPEESQLARFNHSFNTAEFKRIEANSGQRMYSARGRQIDSPHISIPAYVEDLRPFRAGVPALDEFPIAIWSRLVRRRWKSVSSSVLSYGDAAGCGALRRGIADYVSAYRGVRCHADQVMIVSGTQQAVDIVARLTIDPGDTVLFENPGYSRARSALITAGAKIACVPVDENAMDVEYAISKHPSARLAYVTPSHQFPLGVTLPIERRLKLIEWANKSSALIFEDDYDSEYRYAQRPIPALQGLDHGNRTIYVGSFSKVIYPSLGIGYAIVPEAMIDSFGRSLALAGRPASQMDQLILTDFLNEGHFARHLRRMRILHEQRRTALVESVSRHLGQVLEIIGADAGLHCTARLVPHFCDKTIARMALEIGVNLQPLSDYYYLRKRARATPANGLVFGFASSPPSEIRAAVRKIVPLFDQTNGC